MTAIPENIGICRNERPKLISINGPLTIERCDGRETIAQATDLFRYIDSNFRHWGCDAPGSPTGDTQTCVYEMAHDATFAEIFGGWGISADYLALSQAQVIQFVKHYTRWLKPGGNGTFFLFEAHHVFFVAAVYFFCDGRLGVRIRPFTLERIFRAGKHHRLVVPQLTSATCFLARPSFVT